MGSSVGVDQSGKVEDTATDTVLAFSNGVPYAVLIPASVKRTCLHELRRRGRSGKSIYWLLFATGLFLLLQDHLAALSSVTIDVEYQGHSARIKEHLLNLLRRAHVPVASHQINFRRIGKKSPAHGRAYLVKRGREAPDRIVSAEELLAQFQ